MADLKEASDNVGYRNNKNGARKRGTGAPPPEMYFIPGFDTIFTPLIYFSKLCNAKIIAQIIQHY